MNFHDQTIVGYVTGSEMAQTKGGGTEYVKVWIQPVNYKNEFDGDPIQVVAFHNKAVLMNAPPNQLVVVIGTITVKPRTRGPYMSWGFAIDTVAYVASPPSDNGGHGTAGHGPAESYQQQSYPHQQGRQQPVAQQKQVQNPYRANAPMKPFPQMNGSSAGSPQQSENEPLNDIPF